MLANDFYVVVDDVPVRSSSTGGSAIIFAAMISLINARRATQNNDPLGFINPFLYQQGDLQYYPEQPIATSDDGVSTYFLISTHYI